MLRRHILPPGAGWRARSRGFGVYGVEGNGTVQFITCTTDSAFASTVAVLEKSYRSEP